MIARCDECHAMLAVETLGEWVEHLADGSHTHHFEAHPESTDGES